MKSILAFCACAIAVSTALLVGCDKKQASIPTDPVPPNNTRFKQENTPENLRMLFEILHQTIHEKKDVKKAALLFRSLLPDEAHLRKALKDDISGDMLRQIVDQHKKIREDSEAREADVVNLAAAEQKVVKVHAATTEEIARYKEGTVAFSSFPGGAKELAKQVLRPGVTFYEVEFLEPGKDAGMKYHLIYWDGQEWAMLGPMWRVLR